MLDRLRDTLAELSVVGSYGRRGFERRSPNFTPITADLRGRTCVITGANSGIGFAAADALAGLGATVVMACRSASRGHQARTELLRANPEARLELERVDMSSIADVRRFAERLVARTDRVDVLVHNAGVMVDALDRTPEGYERTFATNVLGGFALTALLRDALGAADGGRVVHVTSGGMYTQRLDLQVLRGASRRFDGVLAYAQTKRAQVVLSELWAERLAPRGITSNAMHPGWADTPGVASSMPRFHARLRHELRTPAQGADTVVWLAASRECDGATGQLWLDRKARRTHISPTTREAPATRRALWRLCCEACGVDPT